MYTAVMPHDTMRPNKAPHVVSSLPIVLFFLFNIGYAIVHDGRGRYGGLLRGLFVESVQLELPPHIRNRHNPTLPPHIKGEPLRVNRDCLKANQIAPSSPSQICGNIPAEPLPPNISVHPHGINPVSAAPSCRNNSDVPYHNSHKPFFCTRSSRITLTHGSPNAPLIAAIEGYPGHRYSSSKHLVFPILLSHWFFYLIKKCLFPYCLCYVTNQRWLILPTHFHDELF